MRRAALVEERLAGVYNGGRPVCGEGAKVRYPDAGQPIPEPSDLDSIRGLKKYRGWILGVVGVDPGLLDDAVERVNITLPRRVLRRLDAKAKAAGESRSSYIARMTVG